MKQVATFVYSFFHPRFWLYGAYVSFDKIRYIYEQSDGNEAD